MANIEEKDKQVIQKRLQEMTDPVKIINFTQELECQFCRETRQLLEELAGLSDKLIMQVHNFQLDKDIAAAYKIDKIPAAIIEGAKDYGVRYYGIPAGYEFAALLDTIIEVSKGDSGLGDSTREKLKEITSRVHIQVYVTPTCPYCPKAVQLAHAMAIENDNITADMVEATEFPHLAQKYHIHGVPKTIINEDIHVEGAVPEFRLVQEILKTMEKKEWSH